MALEQITFNLGALEDSANSGKNYVSGQVFEVFNIDDTYADIFADSAGTIPIDQSGVQNISNSDGECKFFIDKGFYNIKSGGKTRQLNANFSFEFETVSDAVNARFISLLEGRRVFIVERDAYFNVVLSSSFSGDGEGMDELTSATNAFYGFKLPVLKDIIDLQWLGQDLSGLTNDSPVIQRAVDLLFSNFNGGVVTWSGRLGWADTVRGKYSVSFKANSLDSLIVPIAGGNVIAGVMLLLNTEDGVNIINEFGRKVTGKLENLHIDNSINVVPSVRFCIYGGGYEFKNILCTRTSQLARDLGTYADFLRMDQVVYRQPQDQNTYYAIDCSNGLGDGFYFNQIEFPEYQGNETKGIHLGRNNGSELHNILNGIHLIENCEGVNWFADHIEGGYIVIDRSSVNIYGGYHYNIDSPNVPIVLKDDGSDVTARHVVNIKDRAFVIQSGLDGNPQTADIQTHPSFELNIENCFRLHSQSGAIDKTQKYGILVRDSSAVNVGDFNNYSHITSRKSTISKGNKCKFLGALSSVNTSENLLAQASLDSTWLFSGVSGTYFYKAQMLLDPVRRIGRTGNQEVSIALTNGGDSARILFNTGANNEENVMLRVFRGNTSGSYDRFVDIPIINARALIDEGDFLSGFEWQSRTAADVTTLNAGLNDGILISQDHCEARTVGSLPTEGIWKRSDKVFKTNSTVDANNMILDAYKRLNDGSGHVNGTDWATLRSSTVSPAN